MKASGRYVSNLDLKYLGAKFITIPDSHLDSSSHLADIRRSRGAELPSILKTDFQDTTLPTSLSPSDRLHTTEQLVSSYMARPERRMRKTGAPEYSQIERKEIDKYRSLIHRIKTDNATLHKEITNLYRQKKLHDSEPKTKAVKKIFKAQRDTILEGRRPKLAGKKQCLEIYQRLNSQDNPYRRESLEIQKKLSSGNLHKNFEAFLQVQNKRVPDFIKNIR